MVRKANQQARSGWVILLTDDDEPYALTTRTLLEREGHTVLLADSGEAALQTGEAVVDALRKDNHTVQVILQTGYASEQPPRDLLKRLDIQGYHDKGEGPDKLLMWVDVGLKAAHAAQVMHKSRQGLRYILNVTPQLHRLQPLDELLQGIICQVTGLLGVADSFLASRPSRPDASALAAPATFLAMRQDDAQLEVHAGTGRFDGMHSLGESMHADSIMADVALALSSHAAHVGEASTIVPLCVGEASIGVIYLDKAIDTEQDLELLSVFANQASVANPCPIPPPKPPCKPKPKKPCP